MPGFPALVAGLSRVASLAGIEVQGWSLNPVNRADRVEVVAVTCHQVSALPGGFCPGRSPAGEPNDPEISPLYGACFLQKLVIFVFPGNTLQCPSCGRSGPRMTYGTSRFSGVKEARYYAG
jgi:hypothetical protein